MSNPAPACRLPRHLHDFTHYLGDSAVFELPPTVAQHAVDA